MEAKHSGSVSMLFLGVFSGRSCWSGLSVLPLSVFWVALDAPSSPSIPLDLFQSLHLSFSSPVQLFFSRSRAVKTEIHCYFRLPITDRRNYGPGLDRGLVTCVCFTHRQPETVGDNRHGMELCKVMVRVHSIAFSG